MTKKRYPLAPESVAKKCLERAQKWLNNSYTASGMFKPGAVAEYLANQEGFTLYENFAQKYYSGIGSRKTPPNILTLMTNISVALERKGYILRSGGATGADTAFAKKVQHNNKEIYTAEFATEKAQSIASQYHPAWNNCKDYVRKLHGRNVQIVLGYGLNIPSEFVVAWTPDGKLVGGTAMGIRIAEANGIKVYNLGVPEQCDAIKRMCEL
jgi:hypothetical protein